MLKQYLQVIKPVIVFSNLISCFGGLSLASKGNINYLIFIFTLIGVLLVVASGCVFNNIIDIDIDSKMERTKNRILVKGLMSIKSCIIYATILLITGVIVIYITANNLTMLLAVIGFIVYVGIYSMYMKRKSVYGTIIGSLAGAVPPVIGYCSVSNEFDTGAIILLLIFIFWQMPHSYAIAIFRLKDYELASIPVLPIKKGINVTKKHITLYIIGFIVATLLLYFKGYVNSYKYLIIMGLINLFWLLLVLQGYKSQQHDDVWAKKNFLFSIIAITSLSLLIAIDKL
ncbi:heme o synthase [Candidatus Palibaumannia cicadellinicola]|uniref:Protoheme IX farnesyltransferase n=1 Tax=Candidatus Palibaumannia cicadellinicola TaxID=186490 RepID=A0A0K2BKV1_9GAMM|nr:heme o synthase [Candidatus Baumannia cicadellinicola]AKZ65822.1 Heme O synthase, protoheme IX farnesyltransferase COX10-CtaB [Candidatus Baumannia cicadellinicola]